jgi:GT2 family glycosyltransferase
VSAAARGATASAIVAINPHDEPFRPTLDAWAAQAEAGDYEVLVVHNGSRPGVRADYDAHRAAIPSTPVRLLEVDVVGRAAANNAGVRAARGDLVLFVADDFRPAPTLVAAHRRFHAHGTTPAVGVGAGFFAPRHREDAFRRWMEDSGMIYGMAFPLAAFDWRQGFFYVGNSSMTRATFDAVGPFDERFRHDLFDDFEWSRRLRARGIPTRYVPRAFAWHDHEVTFEYRLQATERLGEAVRLYERTWEGPRPWGELTSLDPATIAAALAQAETGDRNGTIAASARRWQYAMTLAFLRGYRDA